MDAKTFNEVKARCEAATPGKIIKPSTSDMITALKLCANDEPCESYPCENCYLYPYSKDGRMSTGRTCFEHLAFDAVNAFVAKDAEIARWKSRAEVLERALETEATCMTCIHHGKAETEEPCCNCFGDNDYWQLDEAQFASEKEADYESNI